MPVSGLGFGDTHKQLRHKTNQERNKARQRPAQGYNRRLPLLVGEIQARELGLESHVDSGLAQFPQAHKGVSGENRPSEKSQGVGQDSDKDVVRVEPVHGWILDQGAGAPGLSVACPFRVYPLREQAA